MVQLIKDLSDEFPIAIKTFLMRPLTFTAGKMLFHIETSSDINIIEFTVNFFEIQTMRSFVLYFYVVST